MRRGWAAEQVNGSLHHSGTSPTPGKRQMGRAMGCRLGHFTATSTIDDNLARKKKNGKREGGPESNAISGKMQRKEGTLKHGVRRQRDLWEDAEMVSENGKMRSMQGAERSG